MKYTIKSRYTLYNGIKFRSRLEAKWALFFDKVGWDWTYEPCEINGYNPDFIINTTSESYDTKFIIVEVKPKIFCTNEYKEQIYSQYKDTNAHILILNETPFKRSTSYSNYVNLGFGYQVCDTSMIKYDTEFEMKAIDDFGSSYMQFDGMIYGAVNRKWFIECNDTEAEELRDLWKQCGNELQFIVKEKQ